MRMERVANTEVVHSTYVYSISSVYVVPHVLRWAPSDSAMPIPCSVTTFDTQHGRAVRPSFLARGSDKLFRYYGSGDLPTQVHTGTAITTRVDTNSC